MPKPNENSWNASLLKNGAMETESFDVAFELKDLNENKGEFEGHAAVFDTPDEYKDVFVAGAFKKSLRGRPASKIKMLRQHNHKSLIGVWKEIKEDKDGLFVKGQLLLDIQEAAETFALMKAGALDSMSTGFRTVVDQYDQKTQHRSLLEVRLFEISLVSIPAHADALVSAVKQFSPEDIRNSTDLEKALRDAGFSKSSSKFITAGWTPPAQRDVEGGNDELVRSIQDLAKSMRLKTGEPHNA